MQEATLEEESDTSSVNSVRPINHDILLRYKNTNYDTTFTFRPTDWPVIVFKRNDQSEGVDWFH
jgi:hypothetical protein